MNEGRRTQVILLEDRKLDIIVQPKLEVRELLNIVASHCHLKPPDKDLFGLAYVDEKGGYHWLQVERRVLDHEFPKKFILPGATLMLFHMVKFFADSISQLTHPSSVELYFLQVKHFIQKGFITFSQEEIYQLGALLLQICFGDSQENDLRGSIQYSQVLNPLNNKKPNGQHESEERTLWEHRKLKGMSKGAAMLKYMSIVENCPTYGMHFYPVKDKCNQSWLLGISSKGIFQFQTSQRNTPKRIFQWKQLENLYYRDKKFSIEVHDPKRVVHTLSSFNLYEDAITATTADELTSAVADPTTQVSVSRRAFVPTNVQVFVFFCETPAQCKTIWAISIAQHQFYLDKRQMGKRNSSEQMAEKLTECLEKKGSVESAALVSSTSDLRSSSLSSHSLPSLNSNQTEKSEEERNREMEIYQTLKTKKAALEQSLSLKLSLLKEICIKEGEITGELPKEIFRTLAPGEREPKIKRRVGTAFSIPEDIMDKQGKPLDAMTQLEAEIEIQRRICAAALRLSTDKGTNKSVRRKRTRDYQSAHTRLKDMESKINQMRISASKPDLVTSHRSSENKAWPNFSGIAQSLPGTPSTHRCAMSAPNTPRGSIPDLTHQMLDDEDDEEDVLDLDYPTPTRTVSAATRPPLPPNAAQHHRPSLPNLAGPHHSGSAATSVGSSPAKAKYSVEDNEDNSGSCASLPVYENIGYKTSSSYQSSYRRKQYPTLAPNEGGAGGHPNVHRTHSEHSLPTTSSNNPLPTNLSPIIQPLQSHFLPYGAEAVDHNVGAYNIPHQRTSWNYNSMEQGMNKGSNSSIIMGPPPPSSSSSSSAVINGHYQFPTTSMTSKNSSGSKLIRKVSGRLALAAAGNHTTDYNNHLHSEDSASSSTTSTGGPSPSHPHPHRQQYHHRGLPPPTATGSLDRRLINTKNTNSHTSIIHHQQQQQHYNNNNNSNSSSPSHQQQQQQQQQPYQLYVRTQTVMKPYETCDLYKYSNRIGQQQQHNNQTTTATAAVNSSSPSSSNVVASSSNNTVSTPPHSSSTPSHQPYLHPHQYQQQQQQQQHQNYPQSNNSTNSSSTSSLTAAGRPPPPPYSPRRHPIPPSPPPPSASSVAAHFHHHHHHHQSLPVVKPPSSSSPSTLPNKQNQPIVGWNEHKQQKTATIV